MNETGQMEPVLIGMFDSNFFSSLERVNDIRHIGVRIGLIDEVVQFDQSFFHS